MTELYCGRGSPLRLPNDPDNSAAFSASGISGGIRIRVRLPNVNPQAVAYTILYSAPINDFVLATEVVKMRGEEYYDWFEEPTQRWYWAEQVSINGTHEERLGPVSAISIDPKILAVQRISGEIYEGILATSLRESIERIDSNKSLIDQELLEYAAELGTLQQVTESFQSDFEDQTASYEERLTLLTTDTAAIVENVETLLTEFMGEDGPVTAAIQEVVTTQATVNDALAQSTTQLEAVFADNEGNVEWAALQQQLSKTKVDKINNTIENAWSVKLQSQQPGYAPLIGGFGLINDGSEVQAGFDVDTFWVGRANGSQIYPFIIEGSDIYFNGTVRFSNVQPIENGSSADWGGLWTNGSSYSVGHIVLDDIDKKLKKALTNHTASSANRTAASNWEVLVDNAVKVPTTIYRRGAKPSITNNRSVGIPSGWSSSIPTTGGALWFCEGYFVQGSQFFFWGSVEYDFHNWKATNETQINGGNIAADTITADKINVNDIFSKDITFTGTITGGDVEGGGIIQSYDGNMVINLTEGSIYIG